VLGANLIHPPRQRFHDDEPAGRFKNGIDVGADHRFGDCLVLFAILLRLADRLQRRIVQNCKIVHGCRLSMKGARRKQDADISEMALMPPAFERNF
jgi:hypothetical protein